MPDEDFTSKSKEVMYVSYFGIQNINNQKKLDTVVGFEFVINSHFINSVRSM